MPSRGRWLPLEGEGGELGQTGNLKQSVGSARRAKFLNTPLLLVLGGYEG